MPGFDRTGPMGAGPMSGGARGVCSPESGERIPGYGYGRGLAMRRGFRGGYGTGRGRGYGWHPPGVSPGYSTGASNEIDVLKAQAGYLKDSLDAINQRIDDLESKPTENE